MDFWNKKRGNSTDNHTGRATWLAFLMSVIISFAIWFVSNMAQPYPDIVTVPVTVVTNMDGYARSSTAPADVLANCEMSGFGIVHFRIFARHNSEIVELPAELLHQKSEEEFYVISKDLQQYSREIFGDDATVRYFISDTLMFHFRKVASKKVPVELDASIEYLPQYMQKGSVSLMPDSVTVYADPDLLARTEKLVTSKVKGQGVSSNLSGTCKIKHKRGLRLSEDEVRYYVDVSRYVELRESFPVQVKGVPSDMEMFTVPFNVEVVFRCTFPMTCNPKTDCRFYVEWNDYEYSRSGKCRVKADVMPSGVISYSISDDIVQCVVGEKK